MTLQHQQHIASLDGGPSPSKERLSSWMKDVVKSMAKQGKAPKAIWRQICSVCVASGEALPSIKLVQEYKRYTDKNSDLGTVDAVEEVVSRNR